MKIKYTTARIALFCCTLLMTSSALALTSYTDPAGYPKAWPAQLDSASYAYTSQGTAQADLTGNSDDSRGASLSGSVDFSSGSNDDQPSIFYYGDGSVLFVRFRVDGPPMQLTGSGQPFGAETWNVLIDSDADGFKEFVIMLNGADSRSQPDDIVVIYDDTNTQKFDTDQDGIWRQDSAVGNNDTSDGETGNSSSWDTDPDSYVWDFGRTRIVQINQARSPGHNNSEYYLDIQVPIEALDASAIGGPTMTAGTPFLMMATTSNSNTDPTQKDLLFRGDFTLADAALPAGDVTTPDGVIIQAPLIPLITDSLVCPVDTLRVVVLDAIRLVGSQVTDTIDSVKFEYYLDVNENGEADDAGQSWTRIGLASRVSGTLGLWQATWDHTGLEDQHFVIRAVATDIDGNTTESDNQPPLTDPSVTITVVTTCPPLPPPGISDINVTVANTLISATSQYNIQFTTHEILTKSVDDIILTFPAGTDISGLDKQDVTVNGIGASEATVNGQTLTIRVGSSSDIPAGTVTVVLRDPPGVVNPSTATTYTLNGSTTQEPEVNTSNVYNITSTATLTSATVTPTSSVTGQQSGYTLTFKLGGTGALTAAQDEFTIVFPNDTAVPDGQVYGVTVNGTPAAAVGTSGSRTMQVETPINLGNETNVTIAFALSSGLFNPTTAATYTLTIATTVETSPVTSNAYTFFDGTTLTPATVVPAPNTVNTTAEYVISAQLGSSGGLSAGVDDIFLDFPATTIVPGTISPANVLVDNGTYATSVTSVVTTPASQQIVLVPGNNVPDGVVITITFKEDAGLVNPIQPTGYTIRMATSQEDTVTSNQYSILSATTQITQPIVTLSNTTKNQLSAYTIDFNVGGMGRLEAGTSTITVVLPAGTTVPGSIAASNVTVNGTASAGVVADAGTRTITITIPASVSIGNNAAVTLVIGSTSAVITNPNANETVTLQAHTSVEPTQVSSAGYAIGSGGSGATFDSITLGTTTVNTGSIYTLFFTPGDAPEIGDHIILTLPNNTTVPSFIDVANVQITPSGGSPSNAQSVSTSASLRQIDLVTPVVLSKNNSHKIEILLAGGLKNPSVPKNYTMTLRTSDEPTDITSPQYAVAASATAITVDSLSVSPTRADEAGSYTIDFTVGSAGALLAGNSTITVTFPAGTTVPASMAASNVTVNGSAAATVVTDSPARTVTITTPINVAGSAHVTLIFAVSSGILNPPANNYTLQVRTSAETTNAVSPSYTTTANTDLAVTSVVATPSAINANAGYVVTFQVGSGSPLTIGDQIIVEFPAGTGIPAIMAAGDVLVNGTSPTIAPFTDQVARRITITTPISIPGNGSVTLSFTAAAGLTNPSAVDAYTLNVSTNIQPTFQTSPTYSITAATTTISKPQVTPSVGVINQLATYTINFNVGAQGALSAGSDTLVLVFNNSTTLSAIQANNVTVNGVQTQTVSKTAQTVKIVVPIGVSIKNSDPVTIVIGSATAVITNPSSSGNYTVNARTSVETSLITSFTYPIGSASTTVTPAIVTPSPDDVDVIASYTVAFNLGSQGALSAGSGTITVIFPNNTSVPFSMNAADITVNGTPTVVTPSTSPSGRSVTITTPVSISSDSAVTVVFASAAGLQNPSTGGTYTAQIHTSVEQTKVTSQGYAIQAPNTTVTPATVTPVSNGVNSTAAYTVAFNVGGSGALQAGSSTITIVFPAGTVIPTSIASSKVTVNGTTSAGVSVSGQEVTITVPGTVTISNSDAVTIVFAATALVQNPPIQGQYTLTVATSAEPTNVVSNPYTIGAATTTVTAATAIPNPATTGVPAAYTVDFNVGGSGALQAGSSTITITFNDSTALTSQSISGATVNGVAAQAVSDAATRTIAATVPASVNVGNNGSVSVFVPSGIITNPGTAASYTLQVKTSVENTNVTSNGYLITAATTTVTAATVTPSPATANTTAQYTFSFDVGAQGALTGGASTITVTLPDNTTLPASIAPANVTVNSTPVVAAVNINQSLRTITITTPVNISASGSVSLVFLSGAGLVNPSTATYTAKVRTGVEATNVTTNNYAINAAGSTISTPTVSVSPNAVETNAAYTVSFSVGSQGRLLAQTSTIIITFPAATTVPASITPSAVKVNGVAVSNLNVVGKTVTITVPPGVLINNSSAVSILFNTAAGLYNPTTIASNYTADVSTSTEPTVVASNTYSITASTTTVTAATVIPNPGTQILLAKYTLSFNTGSVGALQSGVSTITATFPSGTVVPGSITPSNVTINGVASPGVVSSSPARTVTATVPSGVTIGNNTGVIMVIGAASSVLTNPTTGSYTAQVRTSVESSDITTNPYTISTATTTVDSAFVGPIGTTPAGGPSPQTVNTVAQYNIKFRLGLQGGLTAGSSKITLTFPSNTVLPTSIIAGLITVNGTAVTAAPVSNASLRTITITVPAGTPTIAALDTVQVNIANGALIKNPSLAGTYRLSVRTSVEATDIPSKLYTITGATTQVAAATVTPTPDEFGLNARYRLDFSVGAQGALIGGNSTITVTFPANTTIPSNITASTVTVNGTPAAIVVPDSVNRTIQVTVPSAVVISNNGAVVLIFTSSAGIVNPDPATTTLQVKTSVETVNKTSNAYTIKSVAVIQEGNKISLYPRWRPSDNRLAYITEAPDNASGADTGNWNLFTVNRNGGGKQQVTSAISGGTIEDGDPVHYSSLTWTPDGDSLVYTGYQRIIFPPSDTVVTLQLYQIPRTGGTFKKISPTGAVEDSSSQFGGWLDPDWVVTNYAFETAQYPSGLHRIAASLDGNIWVFEPRSTDDGVGTTFKGLVQITNLPTASGKTDGLFQPKWSPDRRSLAVVYKDSANAVLSDIYVISNVDSIMEKTLESSNYGDQAFDYDTEVGAFAVNDLSDMIKITTGGNVLPSWTPSWSADGTQIAYSQDQATIFNLDTFSTSPKNSVTNTNFYVKMRSSNGTGSDSTIIGVVSANNAFPTMSNNGQRFGYFQAATMGTFLQKQKVFYLQTSGKFEPPASPKVLNKTQQGHWKLSDLAYSSLEFPVTAVNQAATFFILEPENVVTELTDGNRYIGVTRHFGPTDIDFFEPATVTVHYTDAEFEDTGLVTGTEQEEKLSLYYFDPSSQAWEKVEGSTVDTDRNLVSAPVTKLGAFGVFYTAPAAGQTFSQIMVYPNPFRPNSGSTNDGDYGTGVIFDLLPLNLDRLDIYNIAGEWVASKDNAIVSTGTPGQWRWRGTNDAGRRVASGMYLYVMEADGERKIGKIAVIR